MPEDKPLNRARRRAHRGRRPTWLEIGVSNAGMRGAAHGLKVLALWGFTKGALGHWPTMVEYRDFWEVSTPQAYRERDRFRRAFPQFSSPEEMWAEMPAELLERMVDAGRSFAELLEGKPTEQQIDEWCAEFGVVPA